MTDTAQKLQGQLQRFLVQEGFDLTLEQKATDGAYNVTTNTYTVTAPVQVTVRGWYDSKGIARWRAGVSDATDTQLEMVHAILEARLLTVAPKRGDYIIFGVLRRSVEKVNPIYCADLILSYEIMLESA